MRTPAVLLIAVCACTANASAAQRAVDRATLDGMGLGTMQTLSDHDGTSIRGKGALDYVFGEGFSPRIPAEFGKTIQTDFSGAGKLPSSPFGSPSGFSDFGPKGFSPFGSPF